MFNPLIVNQDLVVVFTFADRDEAQCFAFSDNEDRPELLLTEIAGLWDRLAPDVRAYLERNDWSADLLASRLVKSYQELKPPVGAGKATWLGVEVSNCRRCPVHIELYGATMQPTFLAFASRLKAREQARKQAAPPSGGDAA